MAPPDAAAVALPLPAPLDVSLPIAAPSSSAAARLRLNAAIAGISAALQELNSTVDALGGEPEDEERRATERENAFSKGECGEAGERTCE